jgi:hypothetical protein
VGRAASARDAAVVAAASAKQIELKCYTVVILGCNISLGDDEIRDAFLLCEFDRKAYQLLVIVEQKKSHRRSTYICKQHRSSPVRDLTPLDFDA